MMQKTCPALLITAPASNQGKTMLTAALARYHAKSGLRVKVFKVGPDFLDPMMLQIASGNVVDQLDLWMVGEERCRAQLFDAACNFDLILIEGVMGLFDGTPSTADLAECFNLPIVAVIDASGMGETIAALAKGLEGFRPSLNFYGILANKVASDKHASIIEKAMLYEREVCQGESFSSRPAFLGSLRRQDSFTLPSRHLGLVQASELDDLEHQLNSACEVIASTWLSQLPPATVFYPATLERCEPLLLGKKIAVARDKAFSFIYPANLQLLEEMGATLSFFSPLEDERFESCDCVYLPGGYPELYLDWLSNSRRVVSALNDHIENGGRIYAECGGMLYLLDSLSNLVGAEFSMAGLMPGKGIMRKRLSALGHQYLEGEQGEIRGHTFHYSELSTELEAAEHARAKFDNRRGEAVYHHGNITASYLHLYFPSNPKATIALLFGRAYLHQLPIGSNLYPSQLDSLSLNGIGNSCLF
jgi:cobyrinic acid a,c-diamide synthase